ncbi:MAG: RidA family protein [Rhizobiaceae bacterium]|nr:RidA family protein [Rhizobiaceae bacterium]PCI02743.1 MAG: enamine deaminase RidA [Hyphomicrobiales bacterium]
MELKTCNPKTGIYPATSDYVHALEVLDPNRFLFVSGTMGLDQEGIAGTSLEIQLELIWSNIQVILSSANMTVQNIVRVTSYLRDASYAEVNQSARVKALAGRIIPTTTIVVTTLVSDWMVETEIIAAA